MKNIIKNIAKIIGLIFFILLCSTSLWGFSEGDFGFSIFIFLLGAIPSYFIIKSFNIKIKKQTEIPFEIKITASYNSNEPSCPEKIKFPSIRQDEVGNWILNPTAPFELTIMNSDINISQQIRDLLDNDEMREYIKENKIVALFAEHNIKVKEIEDYKKKYQGIYLSKIEELKNNSTEWEKLGEMDREDLLIEFREEAENAIYERAECNLDILFEYEPVDITIDDELVKEYGFENIKTYLSYYDINKIRVIENDAYSRPMFEKLAELGLAKRGLDLSKEEILSTLTLKELNTIASNPNKEYKRKNQAIEYILTFENLDQIIGKHISLRSLFKLQPLPQKYDTLNLNEISETWQYHEEEAKLLIQTYRNSYYSWKEVNNREHLKYVNQWEVSNFNDTCPCGKKRTKTYSKNNVPRVPFHIGCTCSLSGRS
jgi:hypothetical protein